MLQWKNRTPEVANLINPSFCALLIYLVIFEHQQKKKLELVPSGFPFPLIYLILPITLRKQIREKVTSRTNMLTWLQNNPSVLIGFSNRAKSLVSFTNDAIHFLLSHKKCVIKNGEIFIEDFISKSKITKYAQIDPEIKDCINKSKAIGRWFYNINSMENIYAAWGVRP